MNRRARLLVLLAALLAAAPAGAPAQFVPPPQGKTVTVEVTRGSSVTIPLTGSDRNLRDLRFGIGRGPRYGSLGALSQDGSRKATVRYTHGDDEDSTEDSFVYTVKAGTGGTGRATVNIRIVDPAPVLAAPAAVDFGDVVLGETPVRSFQLANLGGGLIEGAVALAPPFRLETPGEFSLRRGQGRDFAVTFAPDAPGEFSRRVTPWPPDGSVIVFRGRAVEPFQVRPTSTVLAESADGTRSTTVEVTSRALTNLVISIGAPGSGPVRLPREVTVPAGRTATVELAIPPEEKRAVQDFEVTFASPEYSSAWRFSAPPIPARLDVVTPPDFGEVEPGRTAEAALTVRNTGGAHGHLRLHLDALIRPVGSPEALDIGPGETREVRLKMRLKKGQSPPAEIPVEFNGAGATVPVIARLAGAADATATGDAPRPAAPAPATAAPVPQPVAEPLVSLARAPGGAPRLEWLPQDGWQDLRLHRNGVPFTGYGSLDLPWWRSLLAAPSRIAGFFSSLVNPGGRPRLLEVDPFVVAPADASREGVDLARGELGAPVVWQLMGRREGVEGERPVGSRFHIGPQGVSPLPDAGTAPVTRARGQRVDPSRDGAVVQLFLPHDPAIAGFRFELGALAVLPGGAEFIPVAPVPGVEAATSVGQAEAESGRLTVLEARLKGLPPGSATVWRAVPLDGDRELPPTDPVLVRTTPPPPFPWTALGLALAGAAAAGLLYLRWRATHASP